MLVLVCLTFILWIDFQLDRVKAWNVEVTSNKREQAFLLVLESVILTIFLWYWYFSPSRGWIKTNQVTIRNIQPKSLDQKVSIPSKEFTCNTKNAGQNQRAGDRARKWNKKGEIETPRESWERWSWCWILLGPKKSNLGAYIDLKASLLLLPSDRRKFPDI